MSEQLIDAQGVRRPIDQTSQSSYNLLQVEEMAKDMIQQARKQVESLTAKSGELEEQYAQRRERLAEEHKQRREALDGELAAMRSGTEAELEALRKEVQEKTEQAAREDGYQDGFKKGRETGLAEGREAGRSAAYEEKKAAYGETFEGLKTLLEAAARELDVKKASLFREAEQDVLKLAMAIAEKVLKYEIRQSPKCMLNNVRKALGVISERHSAVIEVHPDDVAVLESHMADVLAIFRESASFRIEANPKVAAGGCVVTGHHGGVDLRVATQLELVEQALLGEDSGETVSERECALERT